MPKFKVTYEVDIWAPAADDCYLTEEENAIIDAIDENDANEKAKTLACKKGNGEVVSVVRIE